jgi:DNA polymerase I
MRLEDLAIALVSSSPLLCIDVETTGLDPYDDHVVGWALADPTHAIYVPTRHSGGGNIENPDAFEKRLAAAFKTRGRLGRLTIAHNAPFDLWMSWKAGVDITEGPIEDTLLREVLINDNSRAYDLESSAHRRNVTPKITTKLYEHLLQFAPRKNTPINSKLMQHFHKLRGDDPIGVEYAAGDGRTTVELWQAQEPLIEAAGLTRVHRLESRLIPHVARLRRRGIRIDTGYEPKARAILAEEIKKRRLYFPADFNASRPYDVLTYLKSQGVTNFPMTPKLLKESANANFLETIEAGRQIIDLRVYEKALGGFVEPLLESHVNQGRIYPELVQFTNGDYGVHGGRFSCRGPNLQQWPKRNEAIGRIVRPFLVPDPGRVLHEFDVSQQEPRIAAHFSDETILLDGYNATPVIDYHSNTARLMGITRDEAKPLGLAIMNGMRGKSIAQKLHIPLQTAYNYVDKFFRAYPKLYEFMLGAPVVAEQRGFVMTMLGRRAYLDPDFAHHSVSRIIQGSAADQMKAMLLRACEYCEAYPQISIIVPIHDAVLVQSDIDYDLKEFHKVLEDNSDFFQVVHGEKVPMKCPLPLGVKSGRNWSEASYGP